MPIQPMLPRLAVSLCLLLFATMPGAAAATAGESVITCTNTTSGASWEIRVDYDKGTVDGFPARISAAAVAWHDAQHNINYTLDRVSGSLTEIVPSVTGGYTLVHRCAVKK
jgi:hypothetical protein